MTLVIRKAAVWRKWAFILSIMVVLAALVYTLIQHRDKEEKQIRIGAAAPDFKVTDLNGRTVQLSDYRGKGVLLNFWGSWCQPCVHEMPRMNEVYRSGIPDTEILAVNIGETKGTVDDFVAEHQLAFPVLLDPSGEAEQAYDFNGLPATYVIDKNGRITKIISGEMADANEIRTLIESVQPKP